MSKHELPTDATPDSPAVPASLVTDMVPIGTIKRYWRNPRRKQNVEKIANSIRAFGFRQPLVVDGDGVIIVGDTRFLGAQSLHLTHVPVWWARDLSPDKVAAYRLADNRIADESEWDETALAQELHLLQELGIADVGQLEALTGFDEAELNRYLDVADEDARQLVPVEVREFPPYTWVLVGIATERYVEIAEHVEAIAAIQDLFCEVSVNDDKP